MHDKLSLVAPEMESIVGLRVVDARIDTDSFGTFTGEMQRVAGPVATAIAKAKAGMAASGLRVGLASEGSIGAEGFLPIVTDTEVVAIVDDEESFILWEAATGHSIVTHSFTVDSGLPCDDDLARAGFPEHGLIVHGELPGGPIHKGIHDRTSLLEAVESCRAATGGPVRIESDLRAHHCPSRRPTIRAAARRLAERLARRCPACRCPGWGEVDVVRGRTCGMCGRPTESVIAVVSGCPRCPERRVGAENRIPVDPALCGRCNP